jgi:hypothetical protein
MLKLAIFGYTILNYVTWVKLGYTWQNLDTKAKVGKTW